MALSSGTMNTRSALIFLFLVNAVVSLDLRGAGNACESEKFYEDLHAQGRDGYIMKALHELDASAIEQAAEYGVPEALCALGTMREHGVGCEKDEKEAARLYLESAMTGFVGGMYNLGTMYWSGSGVQQDHAQAAMWFKEAASQACDPDGYCRRHYLSRFRLGDREVRIERGADQTLVTRVVDVASGEVLWTEDDPDQELERVLADAEAFEEDVEAMQSLPYHLATVWGRDAAFNVDSLLPHTKHPWNTVGKVDIRAGKAWVGGPQLEQGEGEKQDTIERLASLLMSFMLHHGAEDAATERQILLEREAWTKLIAVVEARAAKGDARLTTLLGVLHRAGMGMEPDDAAACKLFKTAADKGIPEAMCNLGVCYERGTAIKQDEKKALEYYKKAADKCPTAKTNYAAMLQHGKAGLQPDLERAAKLYREAAQEGDGAAMNNLGVMYVLGKGVPQDAVEGVRWLRRAVEVPSGIFVLNPKHALDYDEEEGAQRDLGDVPGRNSAAAALYNLGLLYESGLGVSPSAQAAARWFALAAEKAVRDSGNAPGLLI